MANNVSVLDSFVQRPQHNLQTKGYSLCIRLAPFIDNFLDYDITWGYFSLFDISEICDGKMDCAYGIDEWIHNCSSFSGLRRELLNCP